MGWAYLRLFPGAVIQPINSICNCRKLNILLTIRQNFFCVAEGKCVGRGEIREEGCGEICTQNYLSESLSLVPGLAIFLTLDARDIFLS